MKKTDTYTLVMDHPDDAVAEIDDLRARLVERLVKYCVCSEQQSPVEGCDCVCCTTTRLEARLAKAERSLIAAGFIDLGGEAWKPPLGTDTYVTKERLARAERQRDVLTDYRRNRE